MLSHRASCLLARTRVSTESVRQTHRQTNRHTHKQREREERERERSLRTDTSVESRDAHISALASTFFQTAVWPCSSFHLPCRSAPIPRIRVCGPHCAVACRSSSTSVRADGAPAARYNAALTQHTQQARASCELGEDNRARHCETHLRNVATDRSHPRAPTVEKD